MRLNIKNDEPVFSIGTAAKLSGCSVHTLRMYEREGLIIPFKKESKQRLYSKADLERIDCIRTSIKEKKMTVEGIKKVLSLIPCWAIVKCTEKDRENCAAYIGYEKPCWGYNHKDNTCSERECAACDVYRGYTNCMSIKDQLKVLIQPEK
jgi:MerR family transcriptional regulator, heat shock protein HspR